MLAYFLGKDSGFGWLILVGGALGGVAAGFLWTAQGAYFGIASKQLALARGEEDVGKATSLLSGMFATCYLGLEVGCKILAALLRQALGVGTMLFFLSVVAGVSFVGMLFVYPLKEND